MPLAAASITVRGMRLALCVAMRLAPCVALLGACAAPPAPPASPAPLAAPAPAPAPAAATPPVPASFDRSSEEAFRASVLARLLAENLVKSAEPGDEPLVLVVTTRDDHDLQINLHRMWDLCTRRPDLCDDNVSSLIAGVGRTERPAPSRETLVATLRAKEWADYARSQIPEVWVEPFTGELVVVYAFDLPDSVRVATTTDLTTLGLTRPAAAALALANVEKAVGRVDEIARQLSPGATLAVAKQTGLETSLLLQTDQWRAVAPTLACTLYATAPEPSLLTITCGTTADLPKLRKMSAELFATAERPLTAQLLAWTKDHWQVVP